MSRLVAYEVLPELDTTIFHAIVLYLPVIPQGSGHAPASVFTFAASFA